MSTIKDSYDIGIEAIQFWVRFKGKRVRVWPAELTLEICSASRLALTALHKWVSSAGPEVPPWWDESRQSYRQLREADHPPDIMLKYALENLADSELPNIETIQEARLFEATITDIVKNPPGIYLTDIQYWVVVGDADDKKVSKVDSTDEGMLLPLSKVARIDFVPAEPFRPREKSSWSTE